jgi:branched-chain amino acid transport system ATP-binding protein
VNSLEVDGLDSGYGRLPVLHGVSLRVEPNELVAVIGPNGAGKTSLVKAIFGLLPAMKGTIRFGGVDLTTSAVGVRNELGMALVPQTGSTFPHLTVEENLVVSFSSLDRSKAGDALASSYEMFPKLADEPTTGLAPTIVQGLVERIVAFKATGRAVIWVIEENPLEVLRHVERVYVLTNGIVSAELPAAELLTDESLHHLFFGT